MIASEQGWQYLGVNIPPQKNPTSGFNGLLLVEVTYTEVIYSVVMILF